MRFKFSKASLIITGGVIGVVIIIALLIVFFMNGSSKSKISGVRPPIGEAAGAKIEDPKVKESLDREKELLSKGGKYVSATDITAQKNQPSIQAAGKSEKKKEDPESLKNLEAEIFSPPVGAGVGPVGEKPKPKTDGETQNTQKNARQAWNGAPANNNEDSATREAQAAKIAADQKAADERISKARKQKEAVWSKIYTGHNSGKGGFLVTSATSERTADGSSQAWGRSSSVGDMPYLKFLEPYTAVMENGFTSGSKRISFIAKCTQPGTIYGWKVMGTAVANMDTERFDVVISGLLSPEGKRHGVSGYAASIDDSDGIITAVKHEEIPGLIISSALAAASDFFKGLRQDSSSTTVTIAGTVTTPTQASNRLYEAEKAGISSAFKETKDLITPNIKKHPTLIIMKNTPILLYFNPQENGQAPPGSDTNAAYPAHSQPPIASAQTGEQASPLSGAFIKKP